MNNASEYVVKKIDEDEYELWFEDKLMATMTKEEAYPVMLGKVHPKDYLDDQEDESYLA